VPRDGDSASAIQTKFNEFNGENVCYC
jgi:hypothetical protein